MVISSRIDISLPIRTSAVTDKLDPSRVKDRIDAELPILAKSTIDNELASRVRP
jgi:hypothetical protein